MFKKDLVVSDELVVCRFDHGIKLLNPDDLIAKGCSGNYISDHTILSLKEQPFSVYFENTELVTESCNEIAAMHCGFMSSKESVGNPWFKPFKSKSIRQSVENNKSVIKNKQYSIVEETAIRKDDTSVHTLSIKMPWYTHENKVAGLFGCTIDLGKQPLAESLLQLTRLDFFNSSFVNRFPIGTEIDSAYLSKREMECLELTVKGKTAKQIAKLLKISSRTVEEYLANVKTKMGVSSKSELIEKSMSYFTSGRVL